MWTTLRVKILGNPVLTGSPQYCDIYFQEPHQIPILNVRKEFPWAPTMGEEKNDLEIY